MNSDGGDDEVRHASVCEGEPLSRVMDSVKDSERRDKVEASDGPAEGVESEERVIPRRSMACVRFV